jgi:hypothetical protein
LIGLDGAVILPLEFDDISEDNGLYIVQKNDKFQLLDKDLKPLTDLVWDDIRRSDDVNVYRLTIGSQMALFHIISKRLFWEEVAIVE